VGQGHERLIDDGNIAGYKVNLEVTLVLENQAQSGYIDPVKDRMAGACSPALSVRSEV
jgi:hypothetical protein